MKKSVKKTDDIDQDPDIITDERLYKILGRMRYYAAPTRYKLFLYIRKFLRRRGIGPKPVIIDSREKFRIVKENPIVQYVFDGMEKFM